jgi:hypothetical protein
MEKKLPIALFNDVWIDCVFNTKMSILLSQPVNEDLRRITAFLQPRFMFNVDVDKEHIQNFIEKGYTTILVNFDQYNFDQWLYEQVLDVEMDSSAVIEKIIELVDSEHYVNIVLDRFHYPNCPDSQKNHTIHPVLVHGYDSEEKVFHLIEDAAKPSHLDYFKLPFTSFREALNNQMNKDKVKIYYNKLKAATPQPWEPSHEQIVELLQATLEEGKKENGWSNLKYGLSTILDFADTLHLNFPKIKDIGEPTRSLTNPITYHKKNGLLLDYTFHEGFINVDDYNKLNRVSLELSNEWEVIRNVLLRSHFSRNTEKNIDAYKRVKEKLYECYEIEKIWITELITSIKKYSGSFARNN